MFSLEMYEEIKSGYWLNSVEPSARNKNSEIFRKQRSSLLKTCLWSRFLVRHWFLRHLVPFCKVAVSENGLKHTGFNTGRRSLLSYKLAARLSGFRRKDAAPRRSRGCFVRTWRQKFLTVVTEYELQETCLDAGEASMLWKILSFWNDMGTQDFLQKYWLGLLWVKWVRKQATKMSKYGKVRSVCRTVKAVILSAECWRVR